MLLIITTGGLWVNWYRPAKQGYLHMCQFMNWPRYTASTLLRSTYGTFCGPINQDQQFSLLPTHIGLWMSLAICSEHMRACMRAHVCWRGKRWEWFIQRSLLLYTWLVFCTHHRNSWATIRQCSTSLPFM